LAASLSRIRITRPDPVPRANRPLPDIGSELGSAVVRAARGSIKAAEDIGGDLVMVGKGVTRGVAEPARQVGSGIARLTTGMWGASDRGRRGARPAGGQRPRKALAQASARRQRRSAA
jgi:hypothetical protein